VYARERVARGGVAEPIAAFFAFELVPAFGGAPVHNLGTAVYSGASGTADSAWCYASTVAFSSHKTGISR